MHFLNIEYFLVIVEEGSFSGAARKLLVSQQSLSEHVKKLEDEIGAPLLTRGPTISLTVAGESFVQGGKEILKARDKMLRDIALVTDKRRRKITIGIPTFEVPPFLPGILAQFAADYPEYETVVDKRQVVDVAKNMGGIDLFFSYSPLDEQLEHALLIDDDRFVVVASETLLKSTYGAHWPEIEQKLLETEDLALLKDLPFILLYDRWGNQANYLTLVFQSAGFSPVSGFQSESGDLNASMCLRGAGAYIHSADICRRRFSASINSGEGSLNMYAIRTPGVKSEIALSYEIGKRLHRAELCFIETARKYLAEHKT